MHSFAHHPTTLFTVYKSSSKLHFSCLFSAKLFVRFSIKQSFFLSTVSLHLFNPNHFTRRVCVEPVKDYLAGFSG